MKIEFIVSTFMEYTIGAIAYWTGKDNYPKYYAFMWDKCAVGMCSAISCSFMTLTLTYD